jgi:hypothetical protein
MRSEATREGETIVGGQLSNRTWKVLFASSAGRRRSNRSRSHGYPLKPCPISRNSSAKPGRCRSSTRREHVFYAEVSGRLEPARLRQRLERERLIRALGLWDEDIRFTLSNKLPALPAKPTSITAIEREAVLRRADLIVARMEIDVLALHLGLARKTRLINALEVAGISTTEKHVKSNGGQAEVDRISRRGASKDGLRIFRATAWSWPTVA